MEVSPRTSSRETIPPASVNRPPPPESSSELRLLRSLAQAAAVSPLPCPPETSELQLPRSLALAAAVAVALSAGELIRAYASLPGPHEVMAFPIHVA